MPQRRQDWAIAGVGRPDHDTNGAPRTPRDAAFVARFDSVMRIPIIISAILPLVVIPQPGRPVGVVVGVVTWLVFVLDFVVHERTLVHFLRTRLGRFDLVVVVLTAPWFLLPGAGAGSFVVALRMARLARLLLATRGVRRLFERIGRVALVALGVVIVASLVAYYAEHPTNREFGTIGDAIWWGTVTMTTVGYGDVVPRTSAGRWAGVTIMVTGISVLGVLAGSLASFFRLDSASDEAQEDVAAHELSGPLTDLVAEVAELRRQVASLVQRLPETPD